MGKRSDFDRIEKDFYRTIDPRAVSALSPHLKPRSIFAEPCVGAGDLADSLEALGHDVQWRTDISEGIDALDIEYFGPIDGIVTNPPWSRPTLHRMIEHFTRTAPYVWLLFDADWSHTKQSKPYMDRCTDIVSAGRLIWIPGTTMSGKDNCAWYRFSTDKTEPTRFYGR